MYLPDKAGKVKQFKYRKKLIWGLKISRSFTISKCIPFLKKYFLVGKGCKSILGSSIQLRFDNYSGDVAFHFCPPIRILSTLGAFDSIEAGMF